MTCRVGPRGQNFEKYFRFFWDVVNRATKARGRGLTKKHYEHKGRLEVLERFKALLYRERKAHNDCLRQFRIGQALEDTFLSPQLRRLIRVHSRDSQSSLRILRSIRVN